MGYNLICGVDEVGRGSLAGPVCSSAIIIKNKKNLKDVNDSKKISFKKRSFLYELIISNCISYGLGFSSPEEIDKVNILEATRLSMIRAVNSINVKPDLILLDGSDRLIKFRADTIPLVRGDNLSFSISCASIIAKVTRDKYMIWLNSKYSNYSFDKNKGYGTRLHIDSIKKYGPCLAHRKSFIKKIIEREN